VNRDRGQTGKIKPNFVIFTQTQFLPCIGRKVNNSIGGTSDAADYGYFKLLSGINIFNC
jgi:hypothetical protein